MGFASTLTEVIKRGPEGQESGGYHYSSMSIAGIDPRDPTKILDLNGVETLNERSFQYWPESISDTIDVGWNFKDIPGASHALAQWASNGGRTISFEVPMHRFIRPDDSRSTQEKLKDPFGASGPSSQTPIDNRPHNVDIVNEIRFLRGFCYPLYEQIGDVYGAFPPPIAILNVPGLRLNESGDGADADSIFAVMTGCDVTYMLSFADGTPRRANVALTFRQVVQRSEGVVYKGWGSGFKIGQGELPDNNIGSKADLTYVSKVL